MSSAPRKLTWQERSARQRAEKEARKAYYRDYSKKLELAGRATYEARAGFFTHKQSRI